MSSSVEKNVRTEPCPHCIVCGSPGGTLYTRWVDRILNTPGEWSWSKCRDNKCGTIWLDPAPIQEDIPKLYINYPTHAVVPTTPYKQRGTLKKLLNLVRGAYLNTNYGYPAAIPNAVNKIMSIFAYLHPGWMDAQAANIFYVPYISGGRLLDVGCGNGSTMENMEQRGWKCTGIDFDTAAIRNAQSRGLNAQSGELHTHNFEEESFDAIIMNHVIEHVPEPVELLQECKRILKKGGVVVMLTPNASSRGHAQYKQHWRGLESDHLNIFTVSSLHNLATKAGFVKVKSFSSLQGVQYVLDTSAELAGKYSTKNSLTSALRWFALGWLHTLRPTLAEVAVVVCKK